MPLALKLEQLQLILHLEQTPHFIHPDHSNSTTFPLVFDPFNTTTPPHSTLYCLHLSTQPPSSKITSFYTPNNPCPHSMHIPTILSTNPNNQHPQSKLLFTNTHPHYHHTSLITILTISLLCVWEATTLLLLSGNVESTRDPYPRCS